METGLEEAWSVLKYSPSHGWRNGSVNIVQAGGDGFPPKKPWQQRQKQADLWGSTASHSRLLGEF